jgi:meiosis-specific protein HOP1
MTHDFDEVPDRYSIGTLDTGHHGYVLIRTLWTVFNGVHSVNLTVTSITPYLPSSTDSHAGRMTLTPLQEVNLSKKLAEVQIEDAANRNVIWVADGDVVGADADADGMDDSDYIRLEDGTYKAIDTTPVPIGIRGQEGVIKALPIQASEEEAQYGGVPERVPTKLQELVGSQYLGNDSLSYFL